MVFSIWSVFFLVHPDNPQNSPCLWQSNSCCRAYQHGWQYFHKRELFPPGRSTVIPSCAISPCPRRRWSRISPIIWIIAVTLLWYVYIYIYIYMYIDSINGMYSSIHGFDDSLVIESAGFVAPVVFLNSISWFVAIVGFLRWVASMWRVLSNRFFFIMSNATDISDNIRMLDFNIASQYRDYKSRFLWMFLQLRTTQIRRARKLWLVDFRSTISNPIDVNISHQSKWYVNMIYVD